MQLGPYPHLPLDYVRFALEILKMVCRIITSWERCNTCCDQYRRQRGIMTITHTKCLNMHQRSRRFRVLFVILSSPTLDHVRRLKPDHCISNLKGGSPLSSFVLPKRRHIECNASNAIQSCSSRDRRDRPHTLRGSAVYLLWMRVSPRDLRSRSGVCVRLLNNALDDCLLIGIEDLSEGLI